MNNPELLVWLIPGYFALLLYRRLNPLPAKQGWEWVFQTASAALVCYVTARLCLMVSKLFPPSFDLGARAFWGSLFPVPRSFSLLLGILPGSFVAALTLAKGREFSDWLEGWLRRFCDPPQDDMLLFRLSELGGELVFVTLKSGKVYVGILVDFTNHPDAGERYLLITPVLSGFRSGADQQVVFTTEYVGVAVDEDDPSPDDTFAEPIVLSMSEVVSISRFNEKMHERFVNLGTTKLLIPEAGAMLTIASETGVATTVVAAEKTLDQDH